MEDFDTDDLGGIADHFVLSASGFPTEIVTDLANENFPDADFPDPDEDGS